MKCNKCQDNLYEYFDGTLKPSMLKSVQEHLAQCPDCNAVFEQERKFSKSMTGLFEQQTRDLSLAPQTCQNVKLLRIPPKPKTSFLPVVSHRTSWRRRMMTQLRAVPQEKQLNVSENSGPFLIPIFNRLPRELMKIAAVIAILLTGFYMGNILWQKRAPDEIMVKMEKGTDWRYILVSPRTCYFLNRPELQLMQ